MRRLCSWQPLLAESIEILLQIIANELPALHDKVYALKFGDVTQRVSCNGNEVDALLA